MVKEAMKMKKQYTACAIEWIKLTEIDVIATSGSGENEERPNIPSTAYGRYQLPLG